ncbi:MAG: hypothetical protein AB8B93_05690 [Pseudomonadales bacterium]
MAALCLGGCGAKDMVGRTFEKTFERSATRIAEADFGPDARYAVAVVFEAGDELSMHGPVVAPLAREVAVTLNETFGMQAVPLDHSPNSEWMELQALATAARGDKGSRPDRGATAFSPFLRQAGYRGYALVTLRETTDGFSRNDYDYSVRGRLSLRELGTDDKGDTESVLARVGLPQSVCSRRLRSQPSPGEMIITSKGYRLTNAQRCTSLIMKSLRASIKPLAPAPTNPIMNDQP